MAALRKTFQVSRAKLAAARRRNFSLIDQAQNRRLSRLERAAEVNTSEVDLSFTPGTAGSILNSTLVAIGDTNISRDGNKIIAKKFKVRIKILKTVATTDRVRIIFLVDKEMHGALPAIGDVLQSAAVDSFYNRDNIQRFRVLRDRTVVFASDDAGGTGDIKQVNYTISLRNMPIWFVGTTAVAASNGKNNIVVVTVADENTTKTSVVIKQKLFFTDS